MDGRMLTFTDAVPAECTVAVVLRLQRRASQAVQTGDVPDAVVLDVTVAAGAPYSDGLVVAVNGRPLTLEPLYQSDTGSHGVYVPLDANVTSWTVSVGYLRSGLARWAGNANVIATVHVGQGKRA